MILSLARFTKDMGISTRVLKPGQKKIEWFDHDLSFDSLNSAVANIESNGIIIIPEVMAANPIFSQLKTRKYVFVQNAFLIAGNLGPHSDYRSLGYEGAIVVMEHIADVLQTFWPIDVHIVPPYVPDYFYAREIMKPPSGRTLNILLFPKSGYQNAGYYDYTILRKILTNHLGQTKASWNLIDLKNIPHKQVSELMQNSVFMLNTNCFESLNATVAEAMAAGCVNLCYEAYGGMDYLKNKVNAYVFPNNYIYSMAKQVIKLIDKFEEHTIELRSIQNHAKRTARKFYKEYTIKALANFYDNLL